MGYDLHAAEKAPAVFALAIRGVRVHKEDTMTGTNPGAWPDQPPKWAEDLEEMPERLYTAADLKAARLEAVDRVMSLADRTKIRPFGYKDETVYEIRGDFVEKLKEKIENEL